MSTIREALEAAASMLSAVAGAVGSRDHPGEKCPNDGSPLWRVTWEQRAAEHHERAVEEMHRANKAEAEISRLEAELSRLRELFADAAKAFDVVASGTCNGSLAAHAAQIESYAKQRAEWLRANLDHQKGAGC